MCSFYVIVNPSASPGDSSVSKITGRIFRLTKCLEAKVFFCQSRDISGRTYTNMSSQSMSNIFLFVLFFQFNLVNLHCDNKIFNFHVRISLFNYLRQNDDLNIKFYAI